MIGRSVWVAAHLGTGRQFFLQSSRNSPWALGVDDYREAAREGLRGQGANAPIGKAIPIVEPDIGIEATFLWGRALACLQPRDKDLPSIFLLESWLILT